MSRIRPHLASALAAALLGALPAEGATLFRAYLSATGADTNPCTLPQPCRLLPAALAAVSEGGEIWMLDSANYNTGTVSIAKSVRILAIPGALGSVVAVNSAAIQVSGTVSVGLKNLTIVPLPPAVAGQVGISVTGAAEVTLEDCEIAGMPLAGIMASSGANLQITRSIVRDNGYVGVYLLAGSSATLAQSHVFGNASDGIFAYAGAPSTSGRSMWWAARSTATPTAWKAGRAKTAPAS